MYLLQCRKLLLP